VSGGRLERVAKYLDTRRKMKDLGNMIHGVFDEDGEAADLFCSDLAVLVYELREHQSTHRKTW